MTEFLVESTTIDIFESWVTNLCVLSKKNIEYFSIGTLES